METEDILIVAFVFEKHKNHKSILKINKHHGDIPSFNLKPAATFYVKQMLKKLKVNKTTGYDQLFHKMVKMSFKKSSQLH